MSSPDRVPVSCLRCAGVSGLSAANSKLSTIVFSRAGDMTNFGSRSASGSVTAIHDDGSLTVAGRCGAVHLPSTYVPEHVDLAYATTGVGAQGRTVDAGLQCVDGATDVRNLYVPMTRGTETNEAFIADGYRNRRVIVFDAATGKYLRHWGAYGKPPDDTQKNANDPATPNGQFSTVHGIIGSRDGMIYVADRRGNRIQVFDHSGKFIREKIIAPETRASGSAFAFAFSPDAAQTFIHMADGTNHKVWNLRRSDLEVVGSFGHGGRQVAVLAGTEELVVRPLGHLFGKNVTRVAFKKGAYLRNFVYEFAELLSERLQRELVARVMRGEHTDYEL